MRHNGVLASARYDPLRLRGEQDASWKTSRFRNNNPSTSPSQQPHTNNHPTHILDTGDNSLPISSTLCDSTRANPTTTARVLARSRNPPSTQTTYTTTLTMRLNLLSLAAALAGTSLADVKITSPAAGATVPAGTMTVKWTDSGVAPALSDFTTYTLQLMVGGNDATNSVGA